MSKTTIPLLVEDFYKTTLSLDVAASGDIELSVSAAPANSRGFIIVDPESSANREKMYYHDVIGNVIYVRGVNRVDPKAHFALDKVQINDTSLVFNYLSRLQSTTFYIEQLTALDINVWGGPVLSGINTVSVTDTPLTVINGETNYIYYKPSTNGIKTAINEITVTNDKGIIVADIVAASGAITSINYRKNGLTTGISIDTIELDSITGLVDTYIITYTDGNTSTFTIKNGRGVVSIAFTSTSQGVDTYTITYNDESESTYEVTNGTSFLSGTVNPTTQGVNGDTYLNTVTGLTYVKSGGTWVVDGGNLTGPTGNGIVGIERTSGDGSPGTTDTYTIAFTNGGTTVFYVWNGVNGTGVVNEIIAGDNIEVDDADVTKPIISAILKPEQVYAKGLTPAQSKELVNGNNPVFLYRLGTGSTEEISKIYGTLSTGEIGLFSGVTDGYENPLNTSSGSNLEVYGNNIYGGVFQHGASCINSMILDLFYTGIGTYNFGIYPFVGNELDENNPLVEINNKDFTDIIYPETILLNTEISVLAIKAYYYLPYIPADESMLDINIAKTGLTTITINIKGDGFYKRIEIYKNDEVSYLTANDITNVYKTYSYQFNLEEGDIIYIVGVMASSSISGSIYMNNATMKIVDTNSSIINFDFLGDIIITPNTNYGFILSNPSGDSSNKVSFNGQTSSGTALLHSTTGISGSMIPITGGVYNKISSDQEITPIDLILNGGIYNHYEDLNIGTTYYVNTTNGEVVSSVTAVRLGTAITLRKILLSF